MPVDGSVYIIFFKDIFESPKSLHGDHANA